MKRSIIAGCGAYLPERIVTNDELATRVDTSDEWISQRTGIRQRHIAADGELTSDLALAAARRALENAGVDGADLDIIVLATATPDNTFPATATRIQAGLGNRTGAAFDVHAVCTGFIYALTMADNMLRLGQANTALVIGAEVFSRILDWEDRTTCVLFGDGAGAVVLKVGEGQGTNRDRGILSTHLHSDGANYKALFVDGGPGSTGTAGVIRMAGREVYKQAVVRMAECVEHALAANGLEHGDVDWLVPHQANLRIIESTGKKLDIPMQRVIVTVDRQANTSAATIPLALAEATADKRVREGHLVALTAMGGGFTWGSALIRW
ncbi:MAG: ketoacyl-ACP synthase III [Alphaproteobacteria bacterium]|nr:ketoacyl-ACP synthase III [Alphaproteobacteria bacterium]